MIGHWTFRTLELVVDGRALIPRPETEIVGQRRPGRTESAAHGFQTAACFAASISAPGPAR